MTYNREESERLVREAEEDDARMTEGPWFFAYRSVCSEPISREYQRLEREIPDDSDDDHPGWDALPDYGVCSVPVVGGDTATAQGARDAEAIARTRNNLRALAAQLSAAGEEIDAHRRTLDEKLGAWQVSAELGKARWDARLARDELATAIRERDEARAGFAKESDLATSLLAQLDELRFRLSNKTIERDACAAEMDRQTRIANSARAECERMRAVYDLALLWQRSGANPCGELGCGCTECGLWNAIESARRKEG